MHNKLTSNNYVYNTRTWVHLKDGQYGSNLRIGPSKSADHLLANRSFRWRSSKQWNSLPIEIRHSKSVNEFKMSLKAWIKTNVPLKPNNNTVAGNSA